MQLFTQSLDGWVHPSDVFITLHGDDKFSFWIDREHHPSDRFSVIGAAAALLPTGRGSLAGYLGELKVRSNAAPESLPFRFRPGLVGAFGYEEQEDRLMLVDRALVFDHDAKTIYFVGVFEDSRDFLHWTQAALLRLALAGGGQAQYRTKHEGGLVGFTQLLHQPADYLKKILKAQDYIRAGDVYQLCLTNQISVETTADPLLTFMRVRELNPSPYSTFLRLGEISLASASPEQFLDADEHGSISSKPIKGTRPRGASPDEDLAISEELRNNQKERAENLMIVDLMRNDLGQVCQTGSVDVPSLFEVETYSTVHQLVSTVTGRLRPETDVFDALAAAFPGGSMTGAPKFRAMEIIEILEERNRGMYSGALGYIGANGVTELCMTIRTLVFSQGLATIGVGGGITIDSEPVAELEETKLKAQALLRALGAEDPWA